jgi:hypothetical protein
MAECVIGSDGFVGIGATASAGLRRLRRGGDEVRDKVRVGAAGRPHIGDGLGGGLRVGSIGLRRGNKSVAHGRLPVPKRDIDWSFPRISQAACRACRETFRIL